MSNCWILVANAARAVIYMSDAKLVKLEEVRSLSHPESRLKNSEINSDAHGRTMNTGTGSASTYSNERDPHDHESDVFAKELAGVLRLARLDGSFDKLIMVAPPKFLGNLRANLDVETGRAVSESVDHDWTAHNLDDLGVALRRTMSR